MWQGWDVSELFHKGSEKSVNYYSRCSFSTMVRWANDGILQANDGEMLVNDGKMLVNDGEMLVNYGEMIIWSNTHFTITELHFTIINVHFTIISLKYTLISSFHHNSKAAPTVLYILILGRPKAVFCFVFYLYLFCT